MRKLIVLISVIMVGISCQSQNEFSKTALNYKLTTTSGEKKSFGEIIESHKGKKIVIEIWAGWCSDCVKAMPKVKEMQSQYPEAVYVFISADKNQKSWQDAITKHQLNGEHYWINDEKMMKGEFGTALELDWIPRYIVIDEKGGIAIFRAVETDFDKIKRVLMY